MSDLPAIDQFEYLRNRVKELEARLLIATVEQRATIPESNEDIDTRLRDAIVTTFKARAQELNLSIQHVDAENPIINDQPVPMRSYIRSHIVPRSSVDLITPALFHLLVDRLVTQMLITSMLEKLTYFALGKLSVSHVRESNNVLFTIRLMAAPSPASPQYVAAWQALWALALDKVFVGYELDVIIPAWRRVTDALENVTPK
jgi:hypothetical protein